MKIKRRKGGVFEDSAASSDVAFLLIIYFLVIAGFNVNIGFLMNLPARDSVRLIQREELLRFEMDQGGRLFYQDREMGLSTAEGEIQRALAGNPNIAVVLLIDGETPWQQVVSFVEIAQKLRVESFSFNLREGA